MTFARLQCKKDEIDLLFRAFEQQGTSSLSFSVDRRIDYASFLSALESIDVPLSSLESTTATLDAPCTESSKPEPRNSLQRIPKISERIAQKSVKEIINEISKQVSFR